MGFGSGPSTGVVGESDDVGEVVFEKVHDGVSGVLGWALQGTFMGVPGTPGSLIADGELR